MDEEHFLVFERFKFHHQYPPVPVLHKQHRNAFIARHSRLSMEAPAFIVFFFLCRIFSDVLSS